MAITEAITVVPANEASWEDLRTVFGQRGAPYNCQCQWFKVRHRDWRSVSQDQRETMLRDQTRCGDATADTTSGLVAYLDGEPVGWAAVEPRTQYLTRLATLRIPWAGRDEDKEDAGVWAVTCFVVRTGFRKRGISQALAAAAADFARRRGARAVEGYSMITEPGREVVWGELFVGARSSFEAAGFREVSHPTPRRVVMRIDFAR